MRLRISVLIVVIACVANAHASGADDVLAACASVSRHGLTTAVTVKNDSIVLDIAAPDGKTSHLTLGTAPRDSSHDSGCSAYSSHDDELVAVGIGSYSAQPRLALGSAYGAQRFTRLQVAVADVRQAKWISNFDVDPRPDFVPASLAGFLGDTEQIVVAGVHIRTGEQVVGSFASLLFNATGNRISATPVVRNPATTTDNLRVYPDALHNRLWFFSCTFPRIKKPHVLVCPITVTSLVGEEQSVITFDPTTYRYKSEALWVMPSVFAALDSTSILVAETVSGNDTVWRVDVQNHTIESLVIKHHFLKYDAMRQAALSPDGQVLGLLLQQMTVRFPYFVDNYIFTGTDIVVLQVNPFRVVATIPHKRSGFATGLAIGHQRGKASILVYRGGLHEHLYRGGEYEHVAVSDSRP
ncbi:MAG: hypothetical protein ACR2IF_04370 [Terriglobales bacterium]